MPERTGQILKLACLALAAWLVCKLAGVALRAGSLARVAIPALPTLASDTNAPAGDRDGATHATKSAATATNPPAGPVTNALTSKTVTNAGSNLVAAVQTPGPARPANGATTSFTARVALPAASTNAIVPAIASHAVAATGSNASSSASATNDPASAGLTTNLSGDATNPASNALARAGAGRKGTDAPPPGAMAMTGPRVWPALPGMPGKPPPPLPPEIKARVDRIYESQLLGQIIRVPLSLLGIAGDFAIIRTPTGQTGLVKEGDSVGDVKLLRIGINRVLVEQGGQKKELMIFNGFGGTSLLTNENTTTQ
jgi:hypothetical protein